MKFCKAFVVDCKTRLSCEQFEEGPIDDGGTILSPPIASDSETLILSCCGMTAKESELLDINSPVASPSGQVTRTSNPLW